MSPYSSYQNKEEIHSLKSHSINMRSKPSISLASSLFDKTPISKFNNINLFKTINRISFTDRNKIRNMNLKKNKIDHDENFLYQYDETHFSKTDELNNYMNILKEEDEEIETFKKKKNKKIIKRNQNIKYKLKDLMTINPYHYVPKKVMFSTFINNNLISDKLNEGGNIISYNEKPKITFPSLGKSNNKNKYKKNRKVIKSQSISIPDPNFKRDELIWRLISRISMTKGVSSLKQAVKYEAITKVWKVHSLIVEKLLVNYQKFKWFLEKEKIISENVFMELISLLKLDKNSGDDFCRKIFLIFDDEGYGNIKVKEFFFFMDITSQSTSTVEKFSFLANLFEDNHRINKIKSVNIEEIPEYFKCIINYENYRKDYKKLVDNIKTFFLNGKNINENSEENYFEKKKVIKFLIESQVIRLILKKFYRDYTRSHKLYDEEIMNVFNSTMRNSKRMLDIHDMDEYFKADLNTIEKDLIAIDNKLKIQSELRAFNKYLNDENEAFI